MRTDRQPKEQSEFEEKVIQVSRVSKKTKGGNKMGFSVLMVVGDKKGRVGVGLGKAKDVQSAVKKGVKKAKKRLINVPMNGTTIPFKIISKLGAGTVMLKPAPKGSGVIAGGPVRAVVEAAGIRDISSKILGSSNQASSVYATFEALKQIERIVKLKGITLKSIAQSEAEAAAKMEVEQEKAKKKADEKAHKEQEERAVAQKSAKSKAKKAAPKKEEKPAPEKTKAETEKEVQPSETK
jgi:small subunit ribosomal protein S5